MATGQKPGDDTKKDVEWYQPAIKSLSPSTIEFFQKYVGINDEQAIKEHIYRIRDKAWKIHSYPCIGLFRFLDFSIHLSPDYEEVVRRVRDGATFLDLGCYFGQDTRKLAYDAKTSANLIGCDREESFLNLGYELFNDRDSLQSTFIPGNVFAENFLEKYRGKIDIVYLGRFLHLFSDMQQRAVMRQLGKLVRPQRGSMVLGRHLGAEEGGPFRMESSGWDVYRHDHHTIKALFQHCKDEGEMASWKVSSSLDESANRDDVSRSWQGDGTQQMMFTAFRL
ncbi:hypothetical protein F4779DRAFT_611818 [Xylariaceae sp. FL0662B]|nr:hypothetical protein F4779DRAFT_611818 [Xylariaceae sp. FL0662B]